MRQTVVLIILHSRTGVTETLAMSHAVGAVQARALIRLRRVADGSPAGPAEALQRMLKEYVVPTEADLKGADAIAIAAPGGARPSDPEWAPCMSMIASLSAAGTLGDKVSAVVDTGDRVTSDAFATALLSHGLVVVPPPSAGPADAAAATTHGRRLASVAQALRK
jgi:hypothetical protein